MLAEKELGWTKMVYWLFLPVNCITDESQQRLLFINMIFKGSF
jgi:hypothetical protein